MNNTHSVRELGARGRDRDPGAGSERGTRELEWSERSGVGVRRRERGAESRAGAGARARARGAWMVERVPVPPEGDRPASRAGSVASSVASRLSTKPVASSSKGELPQLEEEVFEYAANRRT